MLEATPRKGHLATDLCGVYVAMNPVPIDAWKCLLHAMGDKLGLGGVAL